VASQDSTTGKVAEGMPKSGAFVTTRWTVVQCASNSTLPESEAALETLCRAYWTPIYVYVRRFGHAEEDSRDLTQAFFCKLLEKKWIAAANPDKGRFRTFLLSTLKHFLADERDRIGALKRGGDRLHIPLLGDFDEDALPMSGNASPEQIFDYQWALTIFNQALQNLQQEFQQLGKGSDFDVLKNFIGLNGNPVSQKEAAKSLGITEAAAKMSVSRMRRRFRELVRAEIAQTVQDDTELESEVRYLAEVLRQ